MGYAPPLPANSEGKRVYWLFSQPSCLLSNHNLRLNLEELEFLIKHFVGPQLLWGEPSVFLAGDRCNYLKNSEVLLHSSFSF